MRRIQSLAMTLACVAGLLWTAGAPSDRRVWAQDPGLAGTYVARTYQVGVTAWRSERVAELPRLHLLPDNKYVYGSGDSGWHAAYRIFPGGRIELCGLNYRATVTGRPPNRGLEFEYADATYADRRHKMVMAFEDTLARRPPPAPIPPYDDKCKYQSAATDRQVTAGLQLPPFAGSLQAQATPGRIVDGEILLTVRRNPPAAETDVTLWACLIDGGYPRLEYRAPGAPLQRIFVLPDGRFRTRLRGGVQYQWWMTPSGCETPARQQPEEGISTPPGAEEAAATAEKIVLACFVKGGVLSECHGWWLTRP